DPRPHPQSRARATAKISMANQPYPRNTGSAPASPVTAARWIAITLYSSVWPPLKAEDAPLGDVLAKERLADLVAFLREAVEPGWPEPLRLAPSESGPRLLFAIDGEAAPELVERVKAALVYGFEDAGVGLNFEEAPPAVALAACDGESAIVTAEMLEALAAWLPPTYQPED